MIKALKIPFLTLLLIFSTSCERKNLKALQSQEESSKPLLSKRQLTHGILDYSFGEDKNPVDTILDGFSVFDINTSHDNGADIDTDSTGRIYVVGEARNPEYDIALWRLNKNGTLDKTFANQGVILIDDPTGKSNNTGHDYGTSIAITKDDSIIIAGHTSNGTNNDLFLAKYNNFGQLDTSFNGGQVTHSLTNTSSEEVFDLQITSDDKILLVGSATESNNTNLVIWKFTQSGNLDTSFALGQGYKVFDNDLEKDIGHSLTIDSNNNIYIAGESAKRATLWKFTPSGELDLSFNSKGYTSHTTHEGSAKSVSINSKGKILVAGHILYNNTNRYDMALWKFVSTGDLDSSFGGDYNNDELNDGFVLHHGAAGNNKDDYAYGLVIDDYDNAILCGHSEGSTSHDPDMTVWRFTDMGVLDSRFGLDKNPADGKSDGFIYHHNAGGYDQTDICKSLTLNSDGSRLATGFSVSSDAGAQMVVWKIQ